jgi:hypothetical protein
MPRSATAPADPDVVVVLIQREPRQEQFLRELQGWAGGQYTATFSDADSLRDALTRALHEFELARAMSPVDPDEVLARARALVPAARGSGEAQVAVAVAGGPSQNVLRPSQLEADALADELKQAAMLGRTSDGRRAANTLPIKQATLGMGGREEHASLSPAHRTRAALELNRAEIAEDLVVLLRRSRR